ncbi:MAG TPA: SDR family oxidoreductase [Verrucomicrobiae bacterium]|nr:SDR family oxidoreductase [Verrucomicrobiae bacterium]
MRVLIVGAGYVGLPLGAELTRRGHEVFGMRRNAGAAATLQREGIKPLFADITQPNDLAKLPRDFDWVVNCAASGGGSVEDYRRVYLQGMRNVIDWLMPSPREAGGARFVYTSSTSVYGQNDGSIVDEKSPTEPATETGRILLETEQTLLDAGRKRNFAAMILRVAGIYGPERGHWFKQFLSGDARLDGKGERFLNMIHRDDVIGCVIAALERGQPQEIYNAVDDEPVSQFNFFSWLAKALNKPMPEAISENSEATRKRGITNKRISNLKLKTQLGYQFKYPTFREGYAAALQQAAHASR